MNFRAVLAVAVFMSAPAFGQDQNCAPTDQIHARLQEKYGETRQSAGLDNRGVIFELWANSETGSWTALASGAQGNSCILGYGTDWRRSEPEPAGMRL